MQSAATTVMTHPSARQRVRTGLLVVVGLAAFGAFWEVVGRTRALGSGWPALSEVAREFADPVIRSLLVRALRVTATEALVGYVLGVGLAVLSASAGVLWRSLRPGMLNLAAVLQAIPVVALGPLLMAVFPRRVTPIVLASLTVYFTMFLSASVGFSSTPEAREDLLTTLGSGRLRRFRRVQFPSAVPTLVAGLKFAAPTALLGAIIGEWFGTESGIGPILVIAMQNFRMELLWAAATTVSITSMAAYGLLSLTEGIARDRYG